MSEISIGDPMEWPEILKRTRAELEHVKGLLEIERKISAQLEQAAEHYRTALEYLRRRQGKVAIAREDQLELARQVSKARAEASPVLEWVDDEHGARYRLREPRKPL